MAAVTTKAHQPGKRLSGVTLNITAAKSTRPTVLNAWARQAGAKDWGGGCVCRAANQAPMSNSQKRANGL